MLFYTGKVEYPDKEKALEEKATTLYEAAFRL